MSIRDEVLKQIELESQKLKREDGWRADKFAREKQLCATVEPFVADILAAAPQYADAKYSSPWINVVIGLPTSSGRERDTKWEITAGVRLAADPGPEYTNFVPIFTVEIESYSSFENDTYTRKHEFNDVPSLIEFLGQEYAKKVASIQRIENARKSWKH